MDYIRGPQSWVEVLGFWLWGLKGFSLFWPVLVSGLRASLIAIPSLRHGPRLKGAPSGDFSAVECMGGVRRTHITPLTP